MLDRLREAEHENDMLRRTAAFVYLWMTRDGVTDQERVSVVRHRPGWDRFIKGAEPSDELTEARTRAEKAEARVAEREGHRRAP